MAEPQIRPARAADATRLAAVYHSVYQRKRELGFPAKAESVTPETVAGWTREDHVKLAVVGGSVVGGVRLQVTGPDRVKLSRLAVHEDWKGEGVGRALLDSAEAWIRERDRRVFWLTTPPGHPFLVELYEGRGYEVTEEYPFEYRDYDEVRMAKRLD